MIASELRIGNIIDAIGGDDSIYPAEILELHADWALTDNHNFERVSQAWVLTDIEYDGMRGIPLTEEWLIKFGFSKPINSSFYEIAIGGSTLQINPDNGVTWISRNGMSLNITQLIESVHKLQNLFHSWTGEELTIKE